MTVEFHVVGGGSPVDEDDVKCLTAAAESIQLAARIVDTPCNNMHTDIFLEVSKPDYYHDSYNVSSFIHVAYNVALLLNWVFITLCVCSRINKKIKC